MADSGRSINIILGPNYNSTPCTGPVCQELNPRDPRDSLPSSSGIVPIDALLLTGLRECACKSTDAGNRTLYWRLFSSNDVPSILPSIQGGGQLALQISKTSHDLVWLLLWEVASRCLALMRQIPTAAMISITPQVLK